jgi:hypothetical protein
MMQRYSMYSSPEEELLYRSIALAIQPVTHLEREWDAEKFQKKMSEYMKKAANGVGFGIKSWDQCVDEFCVKFYEAYWRALGDRYAYVEKIDFTASLAAACKYHFPQNVKATIPSEDEFNQKVCFASGSAFDQSRWFSWGYQVVKTVITGKTSQKKSSEAVDSTREQLVKSMAAGEVAATKEGFMTSWIQATIDRLKATAGGFSDLLPKALCTRLFDELVQDGGGLPWFLEGEGKPPKGWPEIPKAVELVYGGGSGGLRSSPY